MNIKSLFFSFGLLVCLVLPIWPQRAQSTDPISSIKAIKISRWPRLNTVEIEAMDGLWTESGKDIVCYPGSVCPGASPIMQKLISDLKVKTGMVEVLRQGKLLVVTANRDKINIFRLQRIVLAWLRRVDSQLSTVTQEDCFDSSGPGDEPSPGPLFSFFTGTSMINIVNHDRIKFETTEQNRLNHRSDQWDWFGISQSVCSARN